MELSKVLAGDHGGMAEEAVGGWVLCDLRLSLAGPGSGRVLRVFAVCRHLDFDAI